MVSLVFKICGGRNSFGIQCRKGKHGIYNLGIRVSMSCGCFGVLTATCTYCGQRPYSSIKLCVLIQKLDMFSHVKNNLTMKI